MRDLRPSVPAIPQSAGIDVVKYENSKIITSPAQISFNTYRNTIEWRGLRKKCQKTSFLAILPLVLVIENHGKRAILVSQDLPLVAICLCVVFLTLASRIQHLAAPGHLDQQVDRPFPSSPLVFLGLLVALLFFILFVFPSVKFSF